MQSKIVQATATVLLFTSMAMPVFAGNDNEGRGKGQGMFGDSFRELKLEKKELKQLMKELRKIDRAERHDDDDDEDDEDAASVCLKTAAEAHVAAMRTANSERKTSLNAARTAYTKALADAQKARTDAVMAALATFKASDMGSAAQAAFIAAYVKAHADWQAAKNAAQAVWEPAKAAAEAKWKVAKLNADADFTTAKENCSAPAPTPTTDTAAPAAISGLSLSGATSSSIVLGWSAPGDDGSIGTAASYDIRYSTTAITDANFASAAQVTGEPTPAVAGTAQSMTVPGLTANTTYYFAMRTLDEVPNASALSNVPSLATAL